jgi:CHAD domain-containing protein
VLSGRRIAARFRELEVEITDDTPEGLLDEVLGRLRAAGAGEPDPTPKYVRAVGALATQPAEVAVDDLMGGAPVSAVLGRALAASMVQLLRHDAVMRLDADPEGVHRARVATRRVRSDLRTFRTMLQPEWLEPIREELRWLGSILGEARDADVLLTRIQGRTESIPPTEAPGAAQVVEALDQRRKEAHAVLIDGLRGDRYIALLDRLVEAARGPMVLPGSDAPVRDIVPALLDGPWKHLRAAVRAARKHPGDVELHTVRIRTKRVRYAAETIAPLLGKPARLLADAAAGLQSILGEHHDAVVAESWLRTWSAGRRSGDAAFSAGMLAGIERAAARDARDGWRKAWNSVTDSWKAL